MFLRCAVCDYRLSETKSQIDEKRTLLLCTNCGRVYSKTIINEKPVYRFMGMTQGNNEIREILSLEEPNEV